MSQLCRLAFVVALALVGCSEDADCVSLCEEWVEDECCDKNDLGEGCMEDASKCEETCEDTQKAAKEAGCTKELKAWDACAAELDDICDDSSVCESETESSGFTCHGGKCDEEFETYLDCMYVE